MAKETSPYKRLRRIGILINTSIVDVAVCADLSADDQCKKDLEGAEKMLNEAMRQLVNLQHDLKGIEI